MAVVVPCGISNAYRAEALPPECPSLFNQRIFGTVSVFGILIGPLPTAL